MTLTQYFINKGINDSIAYILSDAIKSSKDAKEVVARLETMSTCIIWLDGDWDGFKSYYAKVISFYRRKEFDEHMKKREIINKLFF